MAEVQQNVRFEMMVDVSRDARRAGMVLRDWLRIGMESFGGSLATAAWARAPLPAGAAQDTEPYGEPGEAWLDLIVNKTHAYARAETLPLSAENWDEFLTRLAGLPDYATIRMRSLDERGRPFGFPGFDVSGDVKDATVLESFAGERIENRWLQLLAYVPAEWLADDAYLERVTEAWLELAHRSDPSFGEIGSGQGEKSELERFLVAGFGRPRVNIPRTRKQLRGYGWVTLCPTELADQLGGEAYLQNSKAFSRVVPLTSGGYWLQATPTAAGYDVAAADRVFRALAPVLIPGQPWPSVPPEPPHQLVLEDPRPGEMRQAAKPERSHTKGQRSGGPPLVFTLACVGELTNLSGAQEWRWELHRDGVACQSWGHHKPGGDRYIKILAELVITQETRRSVAEWIPVEHDGTTSYRAVLSKPTT